MVTLISTPSQLQAINNNLSESYELVNDIDMSGFSFIPLGRTYPFFQAHLDGKGFKISNLKITSSIQYTGLIARTNGGSIKNLGLENVDIQSTMDEIGGLIGLNSLSEIISNCYVTGLVRQTNTSKNYVGGLVGRNLGIVENCYSDCTVSGGSNVGGLFGSVLDYNDTMTITNCYSKSTVTGVLNVGAFVGNAGTLTVYSNNFYANSISPNPIVTGITGKNTVEMNNKSTFTDWDFSNIWYMDGYPKLRLFAEDIPIPSQEVTVILNSYLNIIYSVLERSKRKVSIALSYSTNVTSEATRTLQLMKNVTSHVGEIVSSVSVSNANVKDYEVTSYIKGIGSNASRVIRTIRTVNTDIHPIQIITDIEIPFDVIKPVFASVFVEENPTISQARNNYSVASSKENRTEMTVI